MSDMTPREAADVVATLVTMPWPSGSTTAEALRVLIDHARATAPEGDEEREACGGSECCDSPDHGHVPWSIAQRGAQ